MSTNREADNQLVVQLFIRIPCSNKKRRNYGHATTQIILKVVTLKGYRQTPYRLYDSSHIVFWKIMIENRSLVSQDEVVGWMRTCIRRPEGGGVIHVSIVLTGVMVSGTIITRLRGEQGRHRNGFLDYPSKSNHEVSYMSLLTMAPRNYS